MIHKHMPSLWAIGDEPRVKQPDDPQRQCPFVNNPG
jgi:hypothetical protein